ncbi:MAG: multidrug effflux MFS transporter [Pseudomonadota bacterium]
MTAPERRLSQPEFIALMGMLFATIAFSIDAMLPALPEIADELTPANPNLAQHIITSFVLGMGLGTLVAGPLSDTFGRRTVILAGAALYIVSTVVAYLAQSLEVLLAARLIQGIGAAGPRTVTIAIIRDLYSGRTMAKILSFCMLVFTLFPAVAPMLGQWIIDLSSWRGIFLAFIAFSVFSASWMALRQPETLPAERRLPLRPRVLWAGIVEVLSKRQVVLTIATLSLCFGMLFSVLVSVQPVFQHTFGEHENFPYWFAGIALVSGTSSILNASLVERLGMRFLVSATLAVQIVLSGAMALAAGLGMLEGESYFWAYLFWTTSVFFMAGLTMGNLNALAMEPLGHIAGLAASVVSSVATICSVIIAAPIGQAFDGTPVPVALGICACAVVALALMMFNRAQVVRAPLTHP